jgi:hypothetical protein
MRSYHVGDDEGTTGTVAGNDIKMVSVRIPQLLGTIATGRTITSRVRTFGMSDYCRALFNDTASSKPYMYEL